MEKVHFIYTVPDITKSKQKAHAYLRDYNKKLKEENPDNYKKHTLKNCHWATIEQLIVMFYKHVTNLQKAKIQDADATFKINNMGLAKTREQDKATSYRHIIRLQEAGIITEKINHGTNSSYEIVLNPEILEFMPSSEWCQILIDEILAKTGRQLSVDELQRIHSCKMPVFQPCGGVIAFCNDIVSRTLQELNINMECGNVNSEKEGINIDCSHDFVMEKMTRTQKHVITSKNSQNNEFCAVLTNELRPGNNQTGGGQNLPENARKLSPTLLQNLDFTVSLAWNFAISVLWQGKNILESEMVQAKYFLLEYFAHYYLYKDWQKMSSQVFNEFCQRIQLADRYRRKSPERFIPNPAIYFSPQFKQGFIGTETWYEATIKQREKNQEYYSNLKLLVKFYKEYSANPTIHNYSLAVQALGKKKDKSLLDLFNQCILNSRYFCPEIFHQHYLEQYKVA